MGGRMNIHWSYGLENVCGKSAVGNYPGGEPLITHFPRNGPRIDRLLMRPMSMLDLMGGLFFADALAERGQRDPPELILGRAKTDSATMVITCSPRSRWPRGSTRAASVT
jgi:hypothetical protein